MKPGPQFLPPRQAVIYSYTERMLRETGTNRRTFAMVLAETFLDTTAEDDRDARGFRITRGSGADAAADKKHNGQILGRYLDGVIKTLPANLEDAWVLSLPEPYRSDCERDLARRRGLLPVRMPVPTTDEDVATLARLSIEFGHLMSALAPMMTDGVIGADDLPYARQVLNESDDLITAVVAMRRKVQNLLPAGGQG